MQEYWPPARRAYPPAWKPYGLEAGSERIVEYFRGRCTVHGARCTADHERKIQPPSLFQASVFAEATPDRMARQEMAGRGRQNRNRKEYHPQITRIIRISLFLF